MPLEGAMHVCVRRFFSKATRWSLLQLDRHTSRSETNVRQCYLEIGSSGGGVTRHIVRSGLGVMWRSSPSIIIPESELHHTNSVLSRGGSVFDVTLRIEIWFLLTWRMVNSPKTYFIVNFQALKLSLSSSKCIGMLFQIIRLKKLITKIDRFDYFLYCIDYPWIIQYSTNYQPNQSRMTVTSTVYPRRFNAANNY